MKNAWNASHPEEMRGYRKKWRDAHPEWSWHKTCPRKAAAASHQYYLAHREVIRARTRLFQAKQPSCYGSYRAMMTRCYNVNHKTYAAYGAKGVSVCATWRESFSSFYRDMGSRPVGKTLDRINPFGNYEPSNCRWADLKTQANNTRRKSLCH